MYIQICQLNHTSLNSCISVQEMLKKTGDKGEGSYLGEYSEHNLETQLSLADRMNLDSVKEWCTFGYCSVMP